MSRLFQRLSYQLREHPLFTNVLMSSAIGFCGDVVCQTVYEPSNEHRTRLSRAQLPTEGASSIFLLEVVSPYLYFRQRRLQQTRPAGENSVSAAAGRPDSVAQEDSTKVLVDLRRSFIFCSFTMFFGVPYFLNVYRLLDRYISPHGITKSQAVTKGFLSFIAAQVTNPIYVAYVTALDHYFIFRDGRDGRRRVDAVARVAHHNPMVLAEEDTGDEGEKDSAEGCGAPSGDGASKSDARAKSFSFSIFSFSPRYTHLEDATANKMGKYYRFVEDKSFNPQEYCKSVSTDVTRKLTHDFPDMVRYGFVFWGCNWLPMFYYIPSHFRLLYSSCLQIAWSGIMSHLMHRGNDHNFRLQSPRTPRAAASLASQVPP